MGKKRSRSGGFAGLGKYQVELILHLGEDVAHGDDAVLGMGEGVVYVMAKPGEERMFC